MVAVDFIKSLTVMQQSPTKSCMGDLIDCRPPSELRLIPASVVLARATHFQPAHTLAPAGCMSSDQRAISFAAATKNDSASLRAGGPRRCSMHAADTLARGRRGRVGHARTRAYAGNVRWATCNC